MIKRVIRAATAALGILAALNACQQDRTATATPDRVPDGYVALRFDAEIPAMQEVVTRSVDPDGNGVQNMTLFCFDSFGLFISTATADLSAQSSETGTFSAVVPETRGRSTSWPTRTCRSFRRTTSAATRKPR